jgi:L-threonylcarbamoyladenylate synthase
LSNPLPIAVANAREIEPIACMNATAKRLADRFLPGPLTLVLRKKRRDLTLVTAGLENIAIRIPAHDIALELLSQFGPLTVTSANIHGEKTSHVIKEIQMQFSKKDVTVYLDYGRLEGKPSTIVDVTSEKPVILRQGSITEKEIVDAI